MFCVIDIAERRRTCCNNVSIFQIYPKFMPMYRRALNYSLTRRNYIINCCRSEGLRKLTRPSYRIFLLLVPRVKTPLEEPVEALHVRLFL